jgi:hypothetical protein
MGALEITLRLHRKRVKYVPPDFIGKWYVSPDFISKWYVPLDLGIKWYVLPDFIWEWYFSLYFSIDVLYPSLPPFFFSLSSGRDDNRYHHPAQI